MCRNSRCLKFVMRSVPSPVRRLSCRQALPPIDWCARVMKHRHGCLLFLVVSLLTFATEEPAAKETVTGIGGLFFRAENPGALAEWYEEHLGVSLVPTNYKQKPWTQESGPTVFAPFDEGTEYFGNPLKVWMVNFRVRNLDVMVTQLRAAGIEVEVDPQQYPNGRFARLYDPEGNPIELWEPK